MHGIYQELTSWLFHHVYWAGFFAFIIAFLESLIIIGTIVPGSITMTAVGIMMGAGVMNIKLSLILIIAGAFIGDGLSYYIGFRYRESLPHKWPFRLVPKLIEKAKEFFRQHGGKSVFIGRFVGAIRAMVPVIAGMLNMKPWQYFPISFCSAVLWAIVYLIPGFLIGYASEALPPGMASHVVLYVLGFLVVLWLIYWGVKEFSILFGRAIDRYLDKSWLKLRKNPRWNWLTRLIRNAEDPIHHGQFVLTVLLIFSLIIFITLTVQVIFQDGLTHLNYPVYHIMRGLRTNTLQSIAIVISAFAYKATLVPSTIVLGVYVWLKGYRRVAIHFVAVVGFGSLVALLMKDGLHIARPTGIVSIKPDGSYPSGHVIVATLFYGYGAWLIGFFKPRWKKPAYILASIYLLLIMFARLYCCDHWLTDVLGALFLGLTFVFLGIISYKRALSKKLPIKQFLIPAIVCLIVFAGFTLRHFKEDKIRTELTWPEHQLLASSWWTEHQNYFSSYSHGILNEKQEFINLQWAGNLNNIVSTLESHGWSVFIRNQKNGTNQKKVSMKQFDLLPDLYESKLPAVVLVNNAVEPGLVLKLWTAHTDLKPNQIPLWMGSVTLNTRPKRLLEKNTLAPQANIISALLPALQDNYRWKIVAQKILLIIPKDKP